MLLTVNMNVGKPGNTGLITIMMKTTSPPILKNQGKRMSGKNAEAAKPYHILS